jgi:catalase
MKHGQLTTGLADSAPPPLNRAALFANSARAMGDAPKEIKIRHIGDCLKADPAYGKGVADALGIPLSEVKA